MFSRLRFYFIHCIDLDTIFFRYFVRQHCQQASIPAQYESDVLTCSAREDSHVSKLGCVLNGGFTPSSRDVTIPQSGFRHVVPRLADGESYHRRTEVKLLGHAKKISEGWNSDDHSVPLPALHPPNPRSRVCRIRRIHR